MACESSSAMLQTIVSVTKILSKIEKGAQNKIMLKFSTDQSEIIPASLKLDNLNARGRRMCGVDGDGKEYPAKAGFAGVVGRWLKSPNRNTSH
jgi:hypothetical protein